MEITDDVRRSPEYARYYYDQMNEQSQRSLAQQDSRRLADWAKTSGYLGDQAQAGLPSDDPTLQSQPASGVYTEDFNPQRREMMLRNNAMLSSGIPSLQEQGMSQMGDFQKSRATGLNSLDIEKYKISNTPKKSPYTDTYTGADNKRYGYNTQTGQSEMIPGSADVRQSNNGVNIDFDQGGMKGELTEEEKTRLNVTGPYVWGKDGTPKAVKPSAYSATQMESAGYAERMYEAENILNDLELEGFDPTTASAAVAENLGAAGNYLLDDQQQAMQQARNDWARAKLRDESGAVISEEEIVNEVRTYFPQPGDSKSTLNQKKLARRRATKGLARQSGGAYKYEDREAATEIPAPSGLSEEDLQIYNDIMGGK